MIINGQFLQWIVNNLRWMSLLLSRNKKPEQRGKIGAVADALREALKHANKNTDIGDTL